MVDIPGAGIAGDLLDILGPYLTILILSLLPIIEPRYGLLLGTLVIGVDLFDAFLVSFLAVIILSVSLPYIINIIIMSIEAGLLSKINIIKNIFDRLKTRSINKVKDKYEKYELVGLIIFVAVPLPMTGIYTGALAALVLGLETRKTILALAIGGLASIIITGVSAGLIKITIF